MCKKLFCLCLALIAVQLKAQNENIITDGVDSLIVDSINRNAGGVHFHEISDDYLRDMENLMDQYEKKQKIQKAVSEQEERMLRQEMKFDYFSTLPLIRGIVMTATTDKFNSRDVIFEYHEAKKWHYLPTVTPLAAAWAMKAFGMEARSKTNRMAVANSIGLGLTCGFTELIKNSANELRPNGHDEKSMPSGHTALAFFSAAVLDREFGHYSPWISVGGYSIALATQFHRIHFNHHYLNDVVTGAGIGIVSANLGYFIADKIYGRKGINQPKVTLADANAYLKFVNKPITFALVSSTETGYNKIDEKCYTVEDGLFEGQLRTTAGLSTALEADWFFNENLAAVFSARMAQFKVQPLPDNAPKYSYYGSNIYQYHFNAGIKYSLMSSPSSRMALKAYAGQRLTPETNFLNDKGAQAIHLNKSSDFEFGAGISFDFLSSSKYISGFAVDYTHACTDFMTNRWLISSFWKIML